MASKYDTEVKERVLALWASGINARKVSKTVGVPYSTVLDWIHTAQEEDEDFLAARREAKRRARSQPVCPCWPLPQRQRYSR